MAFIFSNDPVRDAERCAAHQDEVMERLPVCVECGYPIQTEYLFRIRAKSICTACLNANYRHLTEEFMT